MTLLEDPAAAHQIRIRQRGSGLSVSCTCQNSCTGGTRANQAWTGARVRGEVIEVRAVFPAAEAVAAWRAWHEREGIAL